MQQKIPEVDVIMDVLNLAITAFPASPFLKSLHAQYVERGFLTKSQLEGLHSKASKADNLPVGRLATLQAIILKLPTRQKSLPRFPTPLYKKDEAAEKIINEILYHRPQHIAVLQYKKKCDTFHPFSSAEMAELQRIHTLVVKC